MTRDSDSTGGLPGVERSLLFGLLLVLALLVKLTVVAVGVFTGYYTLAVLSLAGGGGLVIWGLAVHRG